MKYISYIITISGDTGWRFNNCPQWNSTEGQLLFDADKWSMEAIIENLKIIMTEIDEESRYCFTFSEKYDNGSKYIVPFIKNTNGVYVNGDYTQSDSLPGWVFVSHNSTKVIHPTKNDEIISWNRDGKTHCYDKGL